MNILRWSSVATVVAALGSAATANVGYFAGAGHSVMLQKTADIQMVSEDVDIVVDSRRADYSCLFELKNLTTGTVAVQVGFPLTADWESRRSARIWADGEFVAPPPLDESKVVAEDYRFIARDADRTYHVRYVERDREARFRHLLLWDMEFAPGETRMLRVSYSLGLSASLFSADRRVWEHWFTDSKIPESLMFGEGWFTVSSRMACIAWCEYVTETGGSWAGRIERATFSVNTSLIERETAESGLAVLGPREPSGGSYARPDLPLTWRGLRPDGWESTRANGYIAPPLRWPLVGSGPSGLVEWRYEPFIPGKRFVVSYVGALLPADAAGWAATMAEEGLDGLPSESDLLALRETLAAMCGIAPTTPRVREVVELLVWYAPFEGRTEADLEEPQRALLAAYDAAVARELERRAALEAAAAK